MDSLILKEIITEEFEKFKKYTRKQYLSSPVLKRSKLANAIIEEVMSINSG
jgi:hypothetical protein